MRKPPLGDVGGVFRSFRLLFAPFDVLEHRPLELAWDTMSWSLEGLSSSQTEEDESTSGAL